MPDLIDATRQGDLRAVEALLRAHPTSLGQVDARGMTALMWAAFLGHTALVRLLLELGADARGEDETGATALVLAAERGHLETVRALVPHASEDERSEALRHAAGEGRATVVRALLDEAGALLDYGGADGKTALTCCVMGGHGALAAELLRRGADKEARSTTSLPFEDRDDSGWRPLHYAADRGHGALVQLLLRAGASVDAGTTAGTTPLMMAVRRGDEELVRLLLGAGADPLRQNARRATALSLSRVHRWPKLTALLEPPDDGRPLATVLPFPKRSGGWGG